MSFEMVHKKSKWGILFITTASTSLVFLDSTIMPVALPTIEKQLQFSNVGAMWVVNAYLLALMSLLLIGGKLIDILGKRTLYLIGFSLFGLGSMFGALSFATAHLIASRVIQGIGGALLLPTTGALLISTFPLGERARALGINTGISSLFLIIGPALGGFLTYYMSWRYLFWINLPIIAFGMFMASTLLQGEKKKEGKFHLLGALPLMFSIVSLVVALMEGSRCGWSSPLILTLFVLFALLFTLFVIISGKAQDPLIDFTLFRSRLFKASNLCIFISQFVVIVTVQWAFYFQQVLHFSPFKTGLFILFATTPIFLIAPLSGILSDRIGPRIPMGMGFLFLMFSFLWLTMFYQPLHDRDLFPGLLAFGCGVPLIFSPAFATAMTDVSAKHLGQASSMITMFRQLGATIGLALMTAVFQSVLHASDSYQIAFTAILYLAIFIAFIGFLLVCFYVKDSNA